MLNYVNYIFKIKIKKDNLFCDAVSTRTTADEIFK